MACTLGCVRLLPQLGAATSYAFSPVHSSVAGGVLCGSGDEAPVWVGGRPLRCTSGGLPQAWPVCDQPRWPGGARGACCRARWHMCPSLSWGLVYAQQHWRSACVPVRSRRHVTSGPAPQHTAETPPGQLARLRPGPGACWPLSGALALWRLCACEWSSSGLPTGFVLGGGPASLPQRLQVSAGPPLCAWKPPAPAPGCL